MEADNQESPGICGNYLIWNIETKTNREGRENFSETIIFSEQINIYETGISCCFKKECSENKKRVLEIKKKMAETKCIKTSEIKLKKWLRK